MKEILEQLRSPSFWLNSFVICSLIGNLVFALFYSFIVPSLARLGSRWARSRRLRAIRKGNAAARDTRNSPNLGVFFVLWYLHILLIYIGSIIIELLALIVLLSLPPLRFDSFVTWYAIPLSLVIVAGGIYTAYVGMRAAYYAPMYYAMANRATDTLFDMHEETCRNQSALPSIVVGSPSDGSDAQTHVPANELATVVLRPPAGE